MILKFIIMTTGRLRGAPVATSKVLEVRYYEATNVNRQETCGPRLIHEWIESLLSTREEKGLWPSELVRVLRWRLKNA